MFKSSRRINACVCRTHAWVSLPLAVVNGRRCKMARSCGVLSLIYVPTEANIPILEARSRFKIIVKVVPVGGMPSIRTSYSGRFRPCRRVFAFRFSNFFLTKISARSVSVFFKISRSVGGGAGTPKKGT
jgi:hypothetical protein